jgi:hypothetical protein
MAFGLAHLADPAALLVTILIEGEHALGSDQLNGLLGIRESVLDVNTIVLLDSIEQLVCLRVQTASVQAASCYNI